MATDLTPGLKAEIVTTVDDKLIVKHMGGDGVLSTPSMIGPHGALTVSANCGSPDGSAKSSCSTVLARRHASIDIRSAQPRIAAMSSPSDSASRSVRHLVDA